MTIKMLKADVRDANHKTTNCPVARAIRRHISNNTGKPAVFVNCGRISAFVRYSRIKCEWYSFDKETIRKIGVWDHRDEFKLPHTIEATL